MNGQNEINSFLRR